MRRIISKNYLFPFNFSLKSFCSITTTSPISYLQNILKESIIKIDPSLNKNEIINLCQVYKAKKGDHYQSPISFNKLLKKESLNTIEVANKIIKNIPKTSSIQDINIVANGFISFELSNGWISKCIPTIVNKSWNTKDPLKTAIVDYASPNMTKEMHVGHLRSIIQGEFICRILEKVGGYNVDRISHVGDFGTPLGKVIAYCLEYNKDLNITASELTELYVNASDKAKNDEQFSERVLQITLELQKGSNKQINNMWNKICSISRESFKDINEWFDISTIECGESFYKDKLEDIVTLLKEKNLAIESNGAQCVFVPIGKKTHPYIVQKKDGSYLYATTDLAALYYRTQELSKSRIIYVTDTAQQLHFQQLFYIGKQLGWLNLSNNRHCQLDHTYFGAVLGEDGTRIKSREGQPIKLKDFIIQAEEKAKDALQKSNFNSGRTDIKRVAQAAIKYYELSNQRTQNYKFSFTHMMQFHGATGTYLLYAYTRISSILEKYHKTLFSEELLVFIKDNKEDIIINLEHSSEISLGKHIIHFWDILDNSYQTLNANIISDYLFILASKFSKFYEHCPILQSKENERISRINLCKATCSILLKGFELLNIKPTRL